MDRRSFLKLLGGLASLPIVGKVVKLGKPASQVAEGIADSARAEGMPDFFYDLVDGVKRFGKKVSEGRDESVYKFKDPETGREVTVTDGVDETYINFESDKGFPADMGIRKGQADETTKGMTPPDEYFEGEVVYKSMGPDDYTKDYEEEIVGGYEGLEEMAKRLRESKASGGIASGPPPKSGPNSQGLETLFQTR